MKLYLAVIASSLFAAGASADDVYGDLAHGNPDLYDQHRPEGQMVAVQPGVGDSFDRYQGWADGNTDLFKRLPEGWTKTDDPRFYQGFGGSPDISY